MYLLDTNVYIVAANNAEFRLRLAEFLRKFGPLPVSSVVMAEVLFGITEVVRFPAAVRALAPSGEVIAPTEEDWLAAAEAVARVEGEERPSKSRSFWNDALLAAQCARLSLTLITQNGADFTRLRRGVAVAHAAPFPASDPKR